MNSLPQRRGGHLSVKPEESTPRRIFLELDLGLPSKPSEAKQFCGASQHAFGHRLRSVVTFVMPMAAVGL